MQTLTLQSLVFVLSLVFGLAVLAVARRWTTTDRRQAAWWLTGVAFTAGGVSAVAHGAFAIVAFFAGPESPFWDGYLRWAPVGNYSRGMLKIVFAALLIVLPFIVARHIAAFRRLSLFLLLLGLLFGGWAGWLASPAVMRHHYVAIAVSTLALVVVLGVALLIHLGRDTMDRLLWLCLCVYGFRLSLGVLWASGWVPENFEVWEPTPSTRYALDAVAYLIMLGLTARFAVLQRHRVYVAAAFESLQTPKMRLFGD